MNNKEILKKAIEKAEKNGYKYSKTFNKIKFDNYFFRWIVYYVKDNRITWEPIDIYYVLFSHDFAKAFFGKQKINGLDERNEDDQLYLTESSKYEFDNFYDSSLGATHDWEVHLQIMILDKEPLKYLEKFL